MSPSPAPDEPAELRIQVHPDLAPALDLNLLRDVMDQIARSEPCVLRHRVEEGEDNGRYLNLAFKTTDRAVLWQALQARLFAHPLLREGLLTASMVVCTGDAGWEDYLLLHHFNPDFPLDELMP